MGWHDQDHQPPDRGLITARWLDEGLFAYVGIGGAGLLALLGVPRGECLAILALAATLDLVALVRRED